MGLLPRKTALLTLDFQHGILQRVPSADAIVAGAARAVEAGRQYGCHILHVGLGFTPGHPEIAAGNATFAAIKKSNTFVIGSPTATFLPDIIRPGEPVIYKQRFGAFSENTLHLVLRAQCIANLVLFGITTSGIVLSTLRRAFDLDYRCIVLKDACFDADAEVHRVLTEKVFPRQAEVVTVDALCAALRTQPSAP